MQQLRRSTVSRAISVLVMAALLTPQCLVYLSGASAQQGQNVPAVAVIPFQDKTCRATETLMREATAASALALEDSKEYLVTSTADLERELAAQRLQPPLSVAQQVRIGERLHVEKVLVGTLDALSVDAATGRAHVQLSVEMLDVALGEYLDGAAVDIWTKSVPGFNGDISQATNEGLREASEAAISKMLSASVRRGTIEMVDDQGTINLNLGTNDGLEVGSELLVVRPTWQPDVEQVVMRQVGRIRISDIEANMATARSFEGGIATTGDRVYRVYKPICVVQAEAKSRKVKNTSQIIAGLLLMAGIISVAIGPTTTTPSGINTANLVQQAPGSNPATRITFSTPGVAHDKTHGFLIFRAANNPDFPAVANYLIDMIPGYTTVYSDDPTVNSTTEDEEITFQYVDTTTTDGSLTDGSVTATFIHPAQVPGNRYFYRLRRITDPLAAPGSNPPIASTAQTTVTPIITPTPDWSIITEGSTAKGPVTYFTVPIQSTPANGAVNQPTSDITFSWQTTTGANEYVVEIFPSSDPDGLNSPVLKSSVLRSTSSTVMSTVIAGPFSASSTYYWRVGARQSSDPAANYPINAQTGAKGFLYSAIHAFTTTVSPPPPPSSGTAQPRIIPGRHGGWWGGSRGR